MNLQELEKIRSCSDNNTKIVIRIFDWDGQLVKFALCKKCLTDSDFSDFISETKINETIPQIKRGLKI